jgi:hypothetical protein
VTRIQTVNLNAGGEIQLLENMNKKKIEQLVEDYKAASPQEFWIEGILYNFIYGLLGALVVVAITARLDIAVLLAYLSYYFFLGKVVNRPKYVTDLGKFIVFPIPTAIGAFIGYKIAPHLINLLV